MKDNEEVRDQIVKETIEQMVQAAWVKETGEMAVGLFDQQGQHVFTLQFPTQDETIKLVVDLRQWLLDGFEQVRERESGLAAS